MLIRQRLSALLALFVSLTVVLGMSTATVANAQSGTPAAVCDASYGSDALAVYKSSSALFNNTTPKVSDIGPLALQSAQLRAQYEDTPAPAGCESQRKIVIQLMKLNEDSLFLTAAVQVDTKNATNYSNFTSSTWQPRFKALSSAVSGASAATPPAATPTSSGTTSGTCSDKTFQTQAMADLNTLTSGSGSDVTRLGPIGLNSIKLRYGYEDMTAPAGCDAARADIVLLLGFGEDLALATVLKAGDAANGATYDAFMNNLGNGPRVNKIYAKFLVDLNMPMPTPAATAKS